MTTSKPTRTATVRKGTNGYGETIYTVTMSQNYNNGIENVERFIESKQFTTERKACNWIEKQYFN